MNRRKGDPFNFDDIFSAVGADNLVKKPLAELKKTQPGSERSDLASSSAASTAPRPVPTAPVPASVKQAPVFAPDAFDFLDAKASKPATAHVQNQQPLEQLVTSSSHSNNSTGLFGAVETSSLPPVSASSDPFHVFEDATVQPPMSAASTLVSGDYKPADVGLDDLFGGAPKPAPPQPSFAPVQSSHAPLVPYPDSKHIDSDFYAPAFQPPPPQQQQRLQEEQAPVASRSPPGVSSSGARQDSEEWGDAQPQHKAPDPWAEFDSRQPISHHSSSRRGPELYSGSAQHPDPPARRLPTSTMPASGPSHAPAPSANSSSGGGGVVGMLKGLGKKAAKAAAAGLQQLETALERLEQQAAPVQRSPWGSTTERGQQPHTRGRGAHQYSDFDEQQPWRSDSSFDRSQYAQAAPDHHDHDHHHVGEDPETIAATLMALPEEERLHTLNSLPLHQQRQVARELDRLERQHLVASTRRSDAGAEDALAVDVRTSGFDIRRFQPHGDAASGEASPRQPSSHHRSPAPPKVAPAAPALDQHVSVNGYKPAAATQHGHEDLLGISEPGPNPVPAMRTVPQPVEQQQPPSGKAMSTTIPGFDDDDYASFPPAPASPALFAEAPLSASQTHFAQPQAPQQAAVHAAADVDDVGDFFSGGATTAAAPQSPPEHDFFGAGSASAASSSTQRQPSQSPSMQPAKVSRPAPSAAPDLMFGLDALTADVDVSAHAQLYDDGQDGGEGEPELRRRLRAARLAEKHAKMKAALAEKVARDEEEARRKAEQVELKERHKAAVEVWRNKNKGNIRGLLGSLQTVLWEGSGWTPIGVGDLLEAGQIRKAWMKANLLVHPDKVRQRNGPPEQVAVADMIFDVLKDAWNTFQATGK